MIYGAKGAGQELAWIADRLNEVGNNWDEIIFIDDFTEKKCIGDHRVIKLDTLTSINTDTYKAIVAVGEPKSRKLLYEKLQTMNVQFETISYPGFVLSDTTHIGPGCIIHEGVIITVNTQIGENSFINKSTVIGHDVTIGKHCTISPRVVIGGNTEIGDEVYIGNGACIRDRIKIGNNAIIGMGAVVIHDVEDNEVVVGNPAKVIRHNQNGKIFK